MNKIILILYAALIAFASLRPMGTSSIEPWDKLMHFLIYAIFAILAYFVVREKKAYLYLCIGIVVYSGLMEVAQSFMPGRVMSAYDLLANTIGVVIGAVIAKTFLPSGPGRK